MSEIDKTIEELEQEVLADINEADALKKGAVKAEPMKKSEAPIDDTGAAVVKSDDKKKDYAKSVKKDGSIPSKDKAMAPEKMKEGYTDEEIRDLCHSKDHDCATVVEHPIWGKGKPIHGSHAIPTDDGYVEWYDVQFKHGLEEKVMASDMEVMVSEAHHEEMDMPKTKDAMITAMNHSMKKMKKKELEAAYKMIMGMHSDKSDDEMEMEGLNKAKEAIEKRLATINVAEDVDALVQGEDLSEDFQKKAATIFEAAVKSKVRSEVERIEEEKTQEISEEVETFKTELAEKVDGYLDYVVKEWMTENELAIERGLKGEISEDFIAGLKNLFEEHYIDVPNEKYDILEAQTQEIEDLKNKVNDLIESKKDSSNRIGELTKGSLVAEASDDLTETQKEKFKCLVEEVEFVSEDSYKEKLKTLKASYFPTEEKKEEVLTEEGAVQTVESSDVMAAYTAAINKTHKRALNN